MRCFRLISMAVNERERQREDPQLTVWSTYSALRQPRPGSGRKKLIVQYGVWVSPKVIYSDGNASLKDRRSIAYSICTVMRDVHLYGF